MFKRVFRLKGRAVKFLTKKWKYFSSGHFSFFFFEQYPNQRFNQISVFVTVKLDKRAVKRNIVKRSVLKVLEKYNFVNQPLKWKFYKIFVILQKNNITQLQEKIAYSDKKDIINFVEKKFNFSLGEFLNKI